MQHVFGPVVSRRLGQRVLNEVIKKRLDLEAVERAIVLLRKHGIEVGCFFVIGLVGESKAEMYETLEYALKLQKLGAANIWFSIAVPYYGTELYEMAEGKGYLKGFREETLSTCCANISTEEWSAEEILKLREEFVEILYPPMTLSNKIQMALKDPILIANFVKKRARMLFDKIGTNSK